MKSSSESMYRRHWCAICASQSVEKRWPCEASSCTASSPVRRSRCIASVQREPSTSEKGRPWRECMIARRLSASASEIAMK